MHDYSRLLEIDGVKLQVAAVYNRAPRLRWSSDDDRSNLFLNLGGGMRRFEASTHSCLFPGAPTLGEFSWVPPDAAFLGSYGGGGIEFLEISVPRSWQAPAWPRLAAFDPRVLQPAWTIAAAVRSGRAKGLAKAVEDLWAYLLHDQKPCDVRRGAVLTDPTFEAVQRHIQQSPGDIRTAVELAERTGASLDGLNRTFQSRLGMSAARFLDEARLRTARRLLGRRDAPLASIALAAGFASQSHLTDRMRDRLGVTPARLRRLLSRWRAEVAGGTGPAGAQSPAVSPSGRSRARLAL